MHEGCIFQLSWEKIKVKDWVQVFVGSIFQHKWKKLRVKACFSHLLIQKVGAWRLHFPAQLEKVKGEGLSLGA